jgi:cytochrome c-type biogenesis protein CcmH
MLLILAFAALLLAVLAAVSLPLLFGAGAPPERGQYDRAVYRDQLREVDRDVARGVLSSTEAGAARLEIQRRLLAVAPAAGRAALRSARSPRLAAAAALFIAGGAGGLYWWLGAPALPDVPYGSQQAAQAKTEPSGGADAAQAPHTDVKAAAERLEEKLRAEPANAEGWVLYARTESTLGNWQRAMDAYQHAIDLGQKGALVYAGYGEMLVMAAGGIVAPAAHDAFVTALAAEPKNDVARYYLALADAQAGEVRKAISAWLALAADLPEDSQMREEIARRVADAARSGGFEAPPLPKGLPEEPPAPAEAAQPGPTQDQMAAAAQMPPAERDKMIRDMIEQLAAKLKTEPNDLDGWLRLGNAYAVQGETDKAMDAYDHAAKLKPDDAGIKLQAVTALLSRLQPSDALPPRAVSLLHEVAAAMPDAPEVLWYLGVVAAREGRPAEARQDWTKLLTVLSPGGEDYKMVQGALKELKEP